MPAAQVPPHDPFQLDRFKPVETKNYNDQTGELRDYLSRRLKQSAFLKIKYGLINAQRELDKISNLETNWDSNGAAPPSADSIQASREILDELAGDLILPSTIVPSAEGGVSVYFMTGNRTAYVESDNQGSQVLVLHDQDGDTEVFELGQDIQRTEVSNRIVAYLD
jgi:hypothetical protein